MTLPIQLIHTKYHTSSVPADRLLENISASLEEDDKIQVDDFDRVEAQVIHKGPEQPSHVVLRLFRKGERTFDRKKINLDSDYQVVGDIEHDYKLTNLDHVNQPHHDILQQGAEPASEAHSTNGFLSISPTPMSRRPNDQQHAEEMAKFAEGKGLSTTRLMGDAATTPAIINALKAPNLVGCFYDGDANEDEIVTAGGYLSYNDVNTYLEGRLNRVTGIWLACNAFNDPLLSAMKKAQSQVYAAGITSLEIPASDNAAVEAMKAAINGEPMKASFAAACLAPGDASEQGTWGFYEGGADEFGT